MSNDSNVEKVKVLIIGSGPAGYTAAIYAARAELKPMMYAGFQPGGQLMITNEVENYPGYPEGIMGPKMMEDFRKQAERFGTEIRYSTVTEVDLSNRPFIVKADDGKTIEAEAVIISTGASAKWLGLESEQRLNGYGVSACAVCDGYFYRGQEVAIVGGGDTAAEEALYLSKLCKKVNMLVRKDQLRASIVMQRRVEAAENINILYNHETLEVMGEKEVEGVKVKNNVTGEEKIIPVTGFFVAIGHKPNTDIFKGQLDMDEVGYLITKSDSTATNIEGVFAAGDAQDKIYRQAVTAAGTGCMAALEAERFLIGREMGA
ncbi:thioredoxin-disulfide reductase [bacterium]|nr:thioredoxin-disulfide reductase [bacterium]